VSTGILLPGPAFENEVRAHFLCGFREINPRKKIRAGRFTIALS
jgi:hypothetical protein